MAKHAPDYTNLTRICEFARRLHQLHRLGGEDAIEGEFDAVCRALWDFTLDDCTDDDLSAEDHAWLDELTRGSAVEFAATQGYDLRDYIHGGLRRRLVGVHVDDPGRGEGRADPGEASRRVVPARREELRVPVPVNASVYLPGLALIRATRSFTVCTGSDGVTVITMGLEIGSATGSKFLMGSYGTVSKRNGLTTKCDATTTRV
jgi:hypothetical protein